MDDVIVIGCDTGGLAAIRAFRDCKDVRVTALTHDPREIAFASRYVHQWFQVPHPARQEEQFIEFLLSNAHRWPGALLLETGDFTSAALARNKDRLSEHYRIVTPDWHILKLFLDKSETYALADRAGVPHPQTVAISTIEQAESVADHVLFPCLLKPVLGHEFFSHFGFKNFQVANKAQLLDSFRQCLRAGHEVLLQEVIPGPESNLQQLHAYINSKGEFAAKFFHDRVRQHPPNFGVMRVGISRPRNPQVEELTERLLKCAQFTGYCDIEFKLDERNGQLKLIEVNPRMARSGGIATASGVNFPHLIYLDLVRGVQEQVNSYAEDVYWIDLYPDLFNILVNPYGERFTWRECLRPYFARHRFAVLDWRDMRPFFRQTRLAVGKASKQLKKPFQHLGERIISLFGKRPNRVAGTESLAMTIDARADRF